MSYFHPIPDQNVWTDVIGKWIVDCIFFVALAFWLVFMLGQQINVSGNSMLPTLADSDKVVVSQMHYQLEEPERLDVVAISQGDEVTVKRIVGLPGEVVQIIDGWIYINDEKLDFQTDGESVLNAGVADSQILLGKDEYFVIGDNWNNSQDSRTGEFGNVKREQIQGKVWLKTWPFKDIGLVD
ncbi:MAG: signal peptidase I [Lachnospiraceae bacterium]|nr:signal peptidase I [Lachnospiraceae bacterium]